MKDIYEELKNSNYGKVLYDVPLTEYTTFKVGGIAKIMIYPKNTKNLISIIKYAKANKIKFMILGGGSNTLFSDSTYEGIIIKLDEFDKLTIRGNTLFVGAGYSTMKVAIASVRKGFAGLEFACGIPGTIGGAVYMNAGAYNSDMGYIVKSVKVLTPDYRVINIVNAECKFKYRSSFFQKNKNYIILEVQLRLKKGNKSELMEIVKDRKARRVASQPLEYPSAGSVFRNPDLAPAGKLIEDLGLKGLTKGGAQISKKHANFIINKNNAKAKDVKELIDFIKNLVKENHGIELKVEQELINWE